MSTLPATQSPAIPEAMLEKLRDAFALEDLAGIDVDALNPQDAATLAFALDAEHKRAAALFAILCKPLLDMKMAARAKVAAAIPADGKALPHPQLVIKLEQATERDRYIDELRRLETLVPEEELRKALYLDQPEPEWKANLQQLDKIARQYGGQIAEIIKKATPEKPKGSPQLVIEARKSTLKAAS